MEVRLQVGSRAGGPVHHPPGRIRELRRAFQGMGKNGINNFVSYGKELFDAANKYLAPVGQGAGQRLERAGHLFPARRIGRRLPHGKQEHMLPAEKMYAKVFPNFGNIVSASIPMGMYMALNEGC